MKLQVIIKFIRIVIETDGAIKGEKNSNIYLLLYAGERKKEIHEKLIV